MIKYKTGYCFNTRDLFKDWDFVSLGIKNKVYRQKYRADSLHYFVSSVFIFFMYQVLVDIIVNNVTFVLPLKGNRHAMIHVKVFEGEQFQKLYAGGKFMGIDFLSSLFKGYQLFFSYNYRGGEREKPIYINGKMKELFYSFINEGRVYY